MWNLGNPEHRNLPGAVIVWSGLLIFSFCCLVFAVAGGFRWWSVLVASSLLVAGFLSIPHHPAGKETDSPLPRWSLLLPILGFLLAVPPGESLPGGWDPGVYLQTAAQISDKGGLRFDHPDLRDLDPDRREILYRDVHGIPEPFGGMRLDPEGWVTPQFYHVYPAVMAFMVDLSGSIGPALYVNPLLFALSIALLMQLANRITGRPVWAVLAGLWFLCIPTQLWQSNFPTAELLTQVCLLGAWCCLFAWSRDPGGGWRNPVLAGFGFGMAMLTRYDSVMVWMILLPVLGFCLADRQYRRGIFLFVLGAVPCAVLWSYHQQIAPYYRPLGPMVGGMFRLCLGMTILAAVAGFLPWQKLWQWGRTWILGAASLGWWGIAGFLWFVRPDLSPEGKFADWLTTSGTAGIAESLTGPSRVSMLYLESNFHPIGLAVILILIPVLWWSARNPAAVAWALTGAGIWLVLAWNPLNDLFMMWVARRFVPVVIPWIVLGTVGGLVRMEAWLRERPRGVWRWIPYGMIALILGLNFPATRFQAGHREWPGTLDWFESVADVVPEEAVLYTDQPGFGSPLRFIWGRKAFELRRQQPELLRRLLDLQATNPLSEAVWFLTTSPMLATEPGWEHVQSVPLHSSMQAHHRTRIPMSSKSRGGDFQLYRWTGSDASSTR